jgi:tetratricopeptide (TPR) repeat protein
VQHNLGNVYAYLPPEDRVNSVDQTIQCYQEALRFRTPETTPNECRRTLYHLGRLYFREWQWQLARNAYRQALRAGEKLYRETVLDANRQAELGESSDIVSDAAYCLAQLGQLPEASPSLSKAEPKPWLRPSLAIGSF